MEVKNNRSSWFLWGAVAAVIILAVTLRQAVFPADGAKGAIGAVQKLHTTQIQQSDVILSGEEARNRSAIVYGDYLSDAAKLQQIATTLNGAAADRIAAINAIQDLQNQISDRYTTAAKGTIDQLTNLLSHSNLPNKGELLGKINGLNSQLTNNHGGLNSAGMTNFTATLQSIIADVDNDSAKQLGGWYYYCWSCGGNMTQDLGNMQAALNNKDLAGATSALNAAAHDLQNQHDLGSAFSLQNHQDYLGAISIESNVLGNVLNQLGSGHADGNKDLGNAHDLGNKGLGDHAVFNKDLGNKDLGNAHDLGNKGLGDKALGDHAAFNKDLGNKDLGNAHDLGNKGLGNHAVFNKDLGNKDLGNKGLGDKALGDHAAFNKDLGNKDLGNAHDLGNKGLGNHAVFNKDLGNKDLGSAAAALNNEAGILQNNALGNLQAGLASQNQVASHLGSFDRMIGSMQQLGNQHAVDNKTLGAFNTALNSFSSALQSKETQFGSFVQSNIQGQLGSINSYLNNQTLSNKELGDKALGNKDLGNKGLGDKALGNKDLGNKGLGDKALGNKDLGNKGLGDKALGNKDLGNKDLGNKGLGDKALGNKDLGNKGLGSFQNYLSNVSQSLQNKQTGLGSMNYFSRDQLGSQAQGLANKASELGSKTTF